jgi:hypothetical protein
VPDNDALAHSRPRLPDENAAFRKNCAALRLEGASDADITCMIRQKSNAVLLLAASSALLCFGAGCADTGQWSIGAKAGTLGVGPELTKRIAIDINARVGFNMLDYDFDADVAGIDYDFDLKLRSFSALVDWHIFDSPFRITGGLLSMDNQLDMDAVPDLDITIGDHTYTAAEVGTLSGRVKGDGIAPYLGVGWGNLIGQGRRWGFYSDFGLAFGRAPDVSLCANGTLASDPGFLADLAREQKDIQDDMDVFKLYPVMSLGIFIRF